MTIRAILLGLLGACVLCGVTYFNDAIIGQTYVVGNNMPIAVYGGLILFLLIFNPLLRSISRRLALTGRELAVIMTLTLAACCIPSSGLMRTFTTSLLTPHHHSQRESSWQAQGVMELLEDTNMLVHITPENESHVLGGFLQGLSTGKDHIPFSEVPWSAWIRPLRLWVPLILTLWIGLIGLSVVVHRQWARHEQLAYPIAAFANSLLPNPNQPFGAVFRNRLFWMGTLGVLVIHVNNFLHINFPDQTIMIVKHFNFTRLLELFPTFARGPHWALVRPTIFFTVVAFAYFLATDVSLSLGIGPYVYCYVAGLLATHGVSITRGGYMEPRAQTFLMFGAFIATFAGLVYMGRHYYGRVFRSACIPFLPCRDKPPSASIWGARVFLVCFAAFTLILIESLQVDWQLALIYTALLVIGFLVLSRIHAETGVFFIKLGWFPCTVLLGMLGVQAFDPKTLLILSLVSVVLIVDSRETLMPFIVNSLKLVDLRRVNVGRTASLCGVAVCLGLAVCIPVTLYFQYDRGMNRNDGWATRSVPRFAFHTAIRAKQRLVAQDSLERANSITGFSRFTHMQPNGRCLVGFAAGAALVGLFTFCRLRFARWPLHPVMFLIWSTYPGIVMATSFMIGWFIKAMVTNYGGASAYQRFKPLMFGLIAGEMLGGLMPMIIGAIWYAVTGEPPKRFHIMPG